ncbi:MAG: AraC family transcriptional regulator [Verrucomicrobiota bacterium]
MPDPETTSSPIPILFHDFGIAARESHHNDDFEMPWTNHDFLKVICFNQGRADLICNNISIRVQPGTLVLIPPNHTHRIVDHLNHPVSLHLLAVRPDQLSVIEKRDNLHAPTPLILHRSERLQRLRDTFRYLIQQQVHRQDGWRTMMLSIANEILVHLIRHGQPIQNNLSSDEESSARVQSYIDELRTEFVANESLDDVSHRLGMSRRSFTQHFRKLTGESRLQVVNRLRIENACRLLSESNTTIQGISWDCGFQELSTFYRVFKRQTGLTPLEFRENLTKQSDSSPG